MFYLEQPGGSRGCWYGHPSPNFKTREDAQAAIDADDRARKEHGLPPTGWTIESGRRPGSIKATVRPASERRSE